MRLWLKNIFVNSIFIYLFLFSGAWAKDASFRLIIHGGAGDINEQNISAEFKKEHEIKLTEALQAGYDILSKGGEIGRAHV